MWILVNIGCLECGISSNIVGVFANKAEADAIAAMLNESLAWREGGQNSFEVFPMPEPETIADEYLEAVAAAKSEATP